MTYHNAHAARIEDGVVREVIVIPYITSAKDMRRPLAQDCAECHSPGEHVDHIVAISRGGSHSIGNLQMLCASCNWNKNDLTLVEWRARRAQAVA